MSAKLSDLHFTTLMLNFLASLPGLHTVEKQRKKKKKRRNDPKLRIIIQLIPNQARNGSITFN